MKAPGFTVFMLLGIGATLFWQQQRNAQLRSDIAVLQSEGKAAAERAARRELAGSPDAATATGPGASQPELAKLRAEIAGYCAELSTREQRAPSPPKLVRQANRFPFQNVGRASAQLSFQTFLWAQSQHDVAQTLASITFDDGAARYLAEMFASQTPEMQAKLETPQRFGAALLARSMVAPGVERDVALPPMHIVADESESAETSRLVVAARLPDGKEQQTVYRFQHGAEGWQVVVSAEQLKASFAAVMGRARGK